MRLRDPAKTIKIIDWGFCKYLDLFYMRAPQKYGAPPGSRLVTPLGCCFGTPEYMAPEMILRENPGPPSFCISRRDRAWFFGVLWEPSPCTQGSGCAMSAIQAQDPATAV